jgi:hypothetical protein
MNHDDIPLVPLRVPGSWLIQHNQLREVDPETVAANDPRAELLLEDLLQASRDDLLIDVGWYPDGNPSGRYRLLVLADLDWHRPLVERETRNLRELVSILEATMHRPPAIPSDRLIERLRGGTPERRSATAEELAHRGAIEAIDAIGKALVEERIATAHDRIGAALDLLVRIRASASTLIPIGFFRELRHGKPDGPSLRESLASSAGPDDAALARYLCSGVVLVAAPGPVRDVLAPDASIIGSLNILTDGKYAWPSDLAHYVERHHARIPDEFVSHAKANNWTVPPGLDVSSLKLA